MGQEIERSEAPRTALSFLLSLVRMGGQSPSSSQPMKGAENPGVLLKRNLSIPVPGQVERPLAAARTHIQKRHCCRPRRRNRPFSPPAAAAGSRCRAVERTVNQRMER